MTETTATPTGGTPGEKAMAWQNRRSRQRGAPPGGGAVYGLGMIGAIVYFLQSAESRWDYFLALPKASVWPALLVYKWLKSFYG